MLHEWMIIEDVYIGFFGLYYDARVARKAMQMNPWLSATNAIIFNWVPIDEFNYRAWHYKNYHVPKIGSHFVGQKRNKVNRVSLTI